MCFHTCAGGGGGSGGMLPRKINDKNGAIWCILNVQKYVIMNKFKDNKSSTTKIIRRFFSYINLNVNVSTEVNIYFHISILKGMLGATAPLEAKHF